MTQNKSIIILIAFFLSFLGVGLCQEQYASVSICQLKSNPSFYNHKLVEVTGFVSHDFEDFTLLDPACSGSPYIWLEYGGKAKSGTIYCCGGSGERTRPKELIVENVPIPLKEDGEFHKFDKLIQPPFSPDGHGSIVHATLAGRFFSGQLIKYRYYPKTANWGGYGHMGCCMLLAIQEIRSVGPQNRADLDYGASADQPDVDKEGCGYQNLTDIITIPESIKAQKLADTGGRDWVFSDPQRVAVQALAHFAKLDVQAIRHVKEVRKSQGRHVYKWKPNKTSPYMVVVSRPYVLSFYARDPGRVAWVVIAAYRLACDKGSKN